MTKKIVLDLAWRAGAFAPFRLANREKALIVTYHRFSADGDSDATSHEVFAEQLAYLSAHYKIVPLSLIAERLASGEGLPSRAAAITIDDGYRDSYKIAFPLLRRHRAPATVFVVTDFIDRKGWLWPDKLRFVALKAKTGLLEVTEGSRSLRAELGDRKSRLAAASRGNEILKGLPNEAKDNAITRIAEGHGVKLPSLPPDGFDSISANEAREMDAAGIEIGSHTVTHPILTCVGEEQLRREMTASKARLEEMLGREVGAFCYPNGGQNSRVRSEVARAGYRYAVTTEHGLNNRHRNLFGLLRVHTQSDPAHFVQSTSGFDELKTKFRAARKAAKSKSKYEADP